LREVTLAYHTELLPLGARLPLTPPEPNNIDTWTQIALEQNLALAGARVAAEVAHEDIRAQYARHLPTIDLSGGHSFQKSGGRFGESEVTSGQIGMQMNLPLYEGGQVNSRTRQAQHQHAQALEALEQQTRAVHRQAREAFLGIVATISSVNALRQAVISAQTAVESTEAGFEVGTRTGVDVVAAERNLSQARRDYARARYDYVLDIFALKQAAGTLSVDDLIAANGWLGETDELLRTDADRGEEPQQ
jgi:outer membrane protein